MKKNALQLFMSIALLLFAYSTIAQDITAITAINVAEVSEADPDADQDDADLRIQSKKDASYHSFIMFDISTLSGDIGSASLKLYIAQHEDESGAGLKTPYRIMLLPVSNVEWDNTLTWNMAQANSLLNKDDYSLAYVDAVDYNKGNDSKWYYVNTPLITNYINSKVAAGETKVAFALVAMDSIPDHDVWVGNWGTKVPTLEIQKHTAPLALNATDVAELFETEPDAIPEEGTGDLKIQKTTNGNDKIAMLKFDLSTVKNPVSNVAIQVYGSQHEGDFEAFNEYIIEVYEAGTSEWTGTELTYNMFQANVGHADMGVALFDMNNPDNTTSNLRGIKSKIVSHVKLTQLINQYINEGKSEIALVFKSGTENNDFDAWFGGTWRAPQLYIEFGEAPLSFAAISDGEVNSAMPDAVNPDENAGDLKMQTKTDGTIIRSYLKFDVSDLTAEQIKLAQIQVYGAQHEPEGFSGRYLIDLYGCDNVDMIDNSTLNYTVSETFTLSEKVLAKINLPAENAVNNKIGKYKYFDQLSLTTYIQEKMLAGATEVGFVMVANETIDSHNAYVGGVAWKAPELIITTTGSGSNEIPENPVIAVSDGHYAGEIEVAITTATEGAKIYYTTDGTEPTDASTLYEGALKISEDTELKAIAYMGATPSEAVATANYTFTPAFFTLTPHADTWIGEAESTTNHDGESDMNIMKADGDERLAILNFDISQVTGFVSNASLHLRGDQEDDETWTRLENFYVELYALKNNNWNEADVTWLDKPTINELLGEENVETSGWHIFSSEQLTAYVNLMVNDPDITKIGFAIRAKESTTGSRVWFSSKDWKAPKLSITTMSEGQSLAVQEDTWVGEAENYVNHDGESDMNVTKINGDNRETFVKFDISKSSKASMMALLLKGAQKDGDGWTAQEDFYVDIYGCDDNTWAEAGMMWINKPALSTDVLVSGNVNFTSSMWISFASEALTNYVNSRIEAGEEFVTFAIVGKENTPGARVWFSSKDWKKPELKLYYGGSDLVTKPEFNPAPGLHAPPSAQVEITTTTNGAEIYYTLDGSVPTIESVKYEGAITITEEQERVMIQAVAIKDGERSYLAKGEYVIGTQGPYDGVPFAIPGSIMGWKFDLGGEGVAYHEVEPDVIGDCGSKKNSINSTRTDGALIDGCCGDGKCDIGWGKTGEWTEYTVNVASAGCYSASLKYLKATDSYPGSVLIEEMDDNNNLIKTLIPETELFRNTEEGNWDADAFALPPKDLGKFKLDAGKHIIRVTWVDDNWNFAELEIHPATDCPAEVVAVTGVTLNSNSLSLQPEGTATLTATIKPENATDKSVTWKSDNSDIATVNESGVVTAIADGTTQITVTTTDGAFTAVCEVTVETPDVPVTGISLDITTLELDVDETATLVATVEPEDATNKSITWTSSNDNVATVDQNGVITYVGSGTANITVTTTQGGFTAECSVNALVGIQNLNISALNNTKIYPNPVNSWLNLEINALHNFNTELQIIDATGGIRYFKSNVLMNSGVNSLAIDVGGFSTGIYCIRFITNGQQVTKKFLLVK